ncbi:hypothetical protein [Ovoidimarina sediminis]|uniref:hypothetical protein n=1 Tax=Ovoidimarina sediminis TaxID=3079856 RepID=UPI00290B2CA3|nr:hypothetical protein [Rhodophyticola sp. MJ-SS7]MDU8945599.1 hypothetical protein [Rhodophyticola sp. MJ-SS7]
MAVMAEGQKQSFQDRIGRIEKGGANTMGTIYMGAVEADGKTIQPKRRKRKGGGLIVGLLMLPLAIVFGGIAMLGGRIGLFQLAAQPDLIAEEYAETIMAWGDLGIGLVLMFVFAVALKMGKGIRKYGLAAGFIAVMLGEPLLIQQAPELFVPAFSEEYVAEMMTAESQLERLPEWIESAKAYIASEDG